MGVGLKPVWNNSFQLDLKLIQRKKVGYRNTMFILIGRIPSSSRGTIHIIVYGMVFPAPFAVQWPWG